MPAVFSDHMVLQQLAKDSLFGDGPTLAKRYRSKIGSNSADAKADAKGRWQVDLPAMTASKVPTTISIKGNNSLEITDVLVGEVWLCSGSIQYGMARCCLCERSARNR